MTDLPRGVSAEECARALAHRGFTFRHEKENYIRLRCLNPYSQLLIPNHPELKPGLLRAIVRHCGLTEEEFTDLLRDAKWQR